MLSPISMTTSHDRVPEYRSPPHHCSDALLPSSLSAVSIWQRARSSVQRSNDTYISQRRSPMIFKSGLQRVRSHAGSHVPANPTGDHCVNSKLSAIQPTRLARLQSISRRGLHSSTFGTTNKELCTPSMGNGGASLFSDFTACGGSRWGYGCRMGLVAGNVLVCFVLLGDPHYSDNCPYTYSNIKRLPASIGTVLVLSCRVRGTTKAAN